jgi:hypothetical protein
MDWNTTLAALAFVASIGVIVWARRVGARWRHAEAVWRSVRREYETDYGPCPSASDGRCHKQILCRILILLGGRMTTLVACDAVNGRIARYECGGTVARKTHEYSWGKRVIFTAPDVERFRVDPPDELSLGPKPTPTPPNAGAGTAGGSPANDEIQETEALAKAA